MRKIVHKMLQGKQWYHQRFDGSPLYLFAVGEGELKKEKRKPAGTEADVRVCFFKDGKADWYLDMKDVRRGSEVMIRLAKLNSDISKKLLHAWRRNEEEFQRFFDRFGDIKLRTLKDQEVLKLYHRYIRLFINRVTSSSIIDHFALGTDEHIAKMLRDEVGRVGKESEFTEIFSIATAPIHQSFINEAEMELLRIALRHPVISTKRAERARGEISHSTTKHGVRSLDFARDDEYFQKDLKAYQRKYFWIKNNYFDAHVLTVAHFTKEIVLWRKSGADLGSKYRQLRNTPRINAQRKAELFRKYRFSRLLRTLIKISEDFTWWQDERKRATYLNIHMGTRILGEMARRRGIDPELTKYLVPKEVEQWFLHDAPSVRELAERQKGCVVMCTREGYYIGTGKEVGRIRALMFPKKVQDTVRDIRGLAASVGRAVGHVKVVGSSREVGKVERGDILVAVMTRPDYIAGIKRAAAIVTNEGGITCHAAIVSRELGVPCVIGTKIATEVLKDDDMVEVNANHGVVTVLKRA